jgi:hypothetical protein
MGSAFLAGLAVFHAKLEAHNQQAFYHAALINTIGKTQ